MRSRGVFGVLTRSYGEGLRRCGCEHSAGEDPGAIGQGMICLDLSGFRRQPESLGRDLEELCGVGEVEPRLDAIRSMFEHRNAMMRAQRGDSLAGPAIAISGLEAVAVQDAGDQIVTGNQRKLTHGCDDVGGGAVALSASAFGQADLAM